MRKSLLFLILALPLFVFTSCKEIDTSDVSTTTMKSGIVLDGFSIYVPEDYEETSSTYIDKYFVKDGTASIIVTNDTDIFQYNNIDQYYQNTILQYQNTFDDFTETTAQNVTIDNKYTAKLAEFSYKIISDDSTIDMSCYTEYILTSNSIYIVTCSAPTSTYQNYRQDFVQSVDSIKIG